MTSMHRTAASPTGMAGRTARAWARSLQCPVSGFAGRPRTGHTLHVVKNHGIVRSLGLAGGGSG